MSGYHSIPLDERKRLRQKMYKKHNLANILTHWFNVAMWLLLLPSGIAIISSPRLGLSPEWLQELYRHHLKMIHRMYNRPAVFYPLLQEQDLTWTKFLNWQHV